MHFFFDLMPYTFTPLPWHSIISIISLPILAIYFDTFIAIILFNLSQFLSTTASLLILYPLLDFHLFFAICYYILPVNINKREWFKYCLFNCKKQCTKPSHGSQLPLLTLCSNGTLLFCWFGKRYTQEKYKLYFLYIFQHVNI